MIHWLKSTCTWLAGKEDIRTHHASKKSQGIKRQRIKPAEETTTNGWLLNAIDNRLKNLRAGFLLFVDTPSGWEMLRLFIWVRHNRLGIIMVWNGYRPVVKGYFFCLWRRFFGCWVHGIYHVYLTLAQSCLLSKYDKNDEQSFNSRVSLCKSSTMFADFRCLMNWAPWSLSQRFPQVLTYKPLAVILLIGERKIGILK